LDTKMWCRIGMAVQDRLVVFRTEERSVGMDGRERVAEFGRELREGPEPSDRSIKEIIDALRPQLQELVNKQVELAKTEIEPVAKRAGLASGLLAAAGVFMLVFLIILSLAGVYILNVFLSLWVSALIVSGILLLVGGILAAAGASILRRLDPKPHRTIRTLEQNISWIKGQLR
jgi:Putative Actinobacterial Holin-X, holin superfamily III